MALKCQAGMTCLTFYMTLRVLRPGSLLLSEIEYATLNKTE